MKNKEIALPWFPITPNYIDQYHESVLKYIRDIRNDESQNLYADSSYTTTVNLLFQRAEQIAVQVCGTELRGMELVEPAILAKDIKILAAASILCSDEQYALRLRFMGVLVYLLALLKKEISDSLVSIYLHFFTAERILSVGFNLDDVIDFEVLEFVKKLGKATFVTDTEERWYENHGTIQVSGESIAIYDFNRYFLSLKKNSSSFKPILSIEDGAIQVMQDKKDKHTFSINSFINTVADITPAAPIEEKKKIYNEGDYLTVKVLNKSYDTIYAVSIDPAYEPVALPVEIISASNVRGIYLTDIARNISLDSTINVTYRPDQGCFSIDETIIEFIRKTFWEDDEENQQYMRMNAILLFPYQDNRQNTWLTEYGFLVRTGYEDLDRYSYRTLEIESYDDNFDFFRATISDQEPTNARFSEMAAKDSLLQLLFFSSKRIITQQAKKKEVKLLNKEHLSLLHRILAIRQNSALNGSENKSSYISICCALAAVAEDLADLDYYQINWSYLQALITFAHKEFKEIKSIDKKDSSDFGVLMKSSMVETLREYDNPEESEILMKIITELSDTELADVAKLVQASNRFIGSQSLERLRDDLHREICTILNITDAIKIVSSQDVSENFPFPPEDDRTEHKMSWVYDNASGQPNETEQSNKILKTICAFMNRYPEQGESHLYIGTDEKRRYINGIKADIDFLICKGELSAKGDPEDEYCRRIMAAIKKRFPETYQYVSPHLKENGQVLDLCVTPVVQGIVYLGGVPYYRYGSESRKMPDHIRQEIQDRKFLHHNDMADKIETINRAIQTEHSVVLKGYDSSNSNTSGTDRVVEAFSFVDNGRYDAIWAYDYSSSVKKNKVFLLRRATGVEISQRAWVYTKQHKKYALDMFGFYGDEKFDFDIEIKTIRAKNILIEQYPDTKDYLESLPDKRWRVHGTLLNKLSLDAACGFYLGLADDIDISKSPLFKEHIKKRVLSLIDIM